MTIKPLVAAIALTAIGTANAQSFLAESPADQIHINDSAFTNAALLATTEDQLALTDQSDGQIGWVTSPFGLKLGVHLGRNVDAVSGESPANYSLGVNTTGLKNFVDLDEAFDLFLASNLGFAQFGFNATLAAESNSDLIATQMGATLGTGTYFYNGENQIQFDDGSDLYTLDIIGNEVKQSSRYMGLGAGLAFKGIPATLSASVALPRASSSYNGVYTDTQNVGATGGAASTARNIDESSNITTSDLKGFETKVLATLNMSSSVRLNGEFYLLSNSVTTADETITGNIDDSDLSVAGITTNTKTTFSDSSEVKDSILVLAAGARHTKQAGAAEIVVQGNFEFIKGKKTSTYTIDQDTYVDVIAGSNNVTGRTGTAGELEEQTLWMRLPIKVSAQWAASEKWTWRAGADANIFYYKKEVSAETSYKADPIRATGFAVDKVHQTKDSTFVVLPSFVNGIDLGFSYSPIENVTFDAKFSKALVESGLTDTGPVEAGSLALTVRY